MTELIARLSEGKTITEESNPDYIALLDFANTYGSKSEAQQNSLTQYLDTYNRLSEDLKNNINQIMIQQSGSDFMAQYNLILERTGTAPAPAEEQNAQAEAPAETQQQPQISAEHQAQINALQTEINQLQTDRDNYYNFLVSEGLPTYSDSTLAAYDNEIAYRQSLVNSLSGQ